MNKYNLLNLLSETIVIKTLNEDKEYIFDGIQIPMIQRDYAHGRDGASGVRKRFLNSIFEALENNKSLPLDFIYGSIKQLDTKNYFIPLDGQQRLTTLFLLYWYIGNKELETTERLELNNKLINFTYATRATARDFCNKLCDIEISFNALPSEEVKNSSWFFEIYEKDPTVKSMLVMLDAIHNKYQLSKDALYPNLSNLTFYLLPLDGFELSDELYIKMNARGKQLTNFENFKADLINWLKDDKNPKYSVFQKKVNCLNQEMPYYLAYATKLDTDWTNIFWELCIIDLDKIKNEDKSVNNEEEKAVVDQYFTRFWNRYLLNIFIIKNTNSNENAEKTAFFSKFYDKGDLKSLLTYDNFDLHQSIFKQESVIEESEKVLDALSVNYNKLKDLINPSWNKENSWGLFDEDISQRQRILFYAITIYLEKNDFDIDNFKNWIRVVWNIIIDPDIRTIPAMFNGLKLIHQLSLGSENIYQFLVKDAVLDIIKGSNLKNQLEEERLKAQLILTDENWEQVIIDAESDSMFMGNIGFLINKNITINDFKDKFKIAKALFNNQGSNNENFKEHLIMRSLISQVKNWSTLEGFDFADTHFNWQFLLRKKDWIGEIIDNFCAYKTIEDLHLYLEGLVSSASNIENIHTDDLALFRRRNAHKSIYENGKFHSWLQENNAITSKWRDHYFYVHRPRSHNDWVMIDVKRNDIITCFINEYDFKTDLNCNGTSYYYGFMINLNKKFKDFQMNLFLNPHGKLKIGLSKIKRSSIEKLGYINKDDETKIYFIKEYDYSNVITEVDVANFMSIIEGEIFSNINMDSLFYKIENL